MGKMRTVFLILAPWATLATAAPAFAVELPDRAQAVLEAGRPYVEVKPGADGSSGVILAAIDVAAPQGVVWSVMTDCDLATKLVANLKSCRILDRDPQGRWDIREDFDPPKSMTFHRTDGDLKMLEGQWRLAQHGDQVRVTYEAHVAAPFAVPGWVARIAMRHDVPMALLALRREAMARTP
jgi:hypothetical protein